MVYTKKYIIYVLYKNFKRLAMKVVVTFETSFLDNFFAEMRIESKPDYKVIFYKNFKKYIYLINIHTILKNKKFFK